MAEETRVKTQRLTWEQHEIGARYETSRRTVHDADLSSFVNLFGFTEPSHRLIIASVEVEAANLPSSAHPGEGRDPDRGPWWRTGDPPRGSSPRSTFPSGA